MTNWDDESKLIGMSYDKDFNLIDAEGKIIGVTPGGAVFRDFGGWGTLNSFQIKEIPGPLRAVILGLGLIALGGCVAGPVDVQPTLGPSVNGEYDSDAVALYLEDNYALSIQGHTLAPDVIQTSGLIDLGPSSQTYKSVEVHHAIWDDLATPQVERIGGVDAVAYIKPDGSSDVVFLRWKETPEGNWAGYPLEPGSVSNGRTTIDVSSGDDDAPIAWRAGSSQNQIQLFVPGLNDNGGKFEFNLGVGVAEASELEVTQTPTALSTATLTPGITRTPTQIPTYTSTPESNPTLDLGFHLNDGKAVEVIHGGNLAVDAEKAEGVRRKYVEAQMVQVPEYFVGYWRDYCKQTGEPTLDKVLEWMKGNDDYSLPYRPEWGTALKIAVSSSTSQSKSLIHVPKFADIVHDVDVRTFGVVVWGWDEYDEVKEYLGTLYKFGTPLGTSDAGINHFFGQGIDRESNRVVFFSGLDFYSSGYQGEDRSTRIQSLLSNTDETSYIGDRMTGKVGPESLLAINAMLAIQTDVIRYLDPEFNYTIGLVDSVSPFDMDPHTLTSDQMVVAVGNE